MIAFRRKPFAHQLAALEFTAARQEFALLMEQGTGKSFVLMNDAARRWSCGELSGVFILAPNGVHTNWCLRELPQDMPEGVPWRAAPFFSDANKAERAAMEALFEPSSEKPLRFLTMNWEALITDKGFAAAEKFCTLMRDKGRGLMIAGDESQRVKSPSSQRFKALKRLRPLSKARAILSGTPITNAPFDAFSQFGFLDPEILETTSFTAFKAEYAQLMPGRHGLMRHLDQRWLPALQKKYSHIQNPQERSNAIERELARRRPQIVMKDEATGRPLWRNLGRLEALIAPHSFRVLKKDCLDLSEKIYTQRYFRLTRKQLDAYNLLQDELRLQLFDDTLAPLARIASITKLSQVVSGYFIVPGTDEVQRIMPPEDNPRLAALLDELEDADGQVIIWARFRAELEDIAHALLAEEIPFVQYHGGITARGRSEAIDSFQGGAARVFLGQQAAGGTGITLTAASAVIYYSNTWSLEDRLQSEDRAHRIGQKGAVRYIDLLAQGTIDEKIVDALRGKINLASIVTGDARRAAALLGFS